ncbi:MAG: cytochrome C oxidase subunit IV family protein [Ilumatobacteraceae bacterium]
MTTTEHADHTDHTSHGAHHEDASHKPNSFYIKVAAALAIVTGIEVALYYLHLGAWYLPILLVLMLIKFLTVVSLFMHLKYDNKLFSMLFYSGLILAVLVYIAALMTFRFFDGG